MTRLPNNAPAYARDLELRALRAEARLQGLEEGLQWLRAYLESPKYGALAAGGNPYVERNDVLARMADAIDLSLDYVAAFGR